MSLSHPGHRGGVGGRFGASLFAVVLCASALVVQPATAAQRGTAVSPYTLAPSTVLSEVSRVPLAVFNAVGVSSPLVQLAPFSVLHGARPYLAKLRDGKSVPGSFYWGGEYCPYCAVSRWGLIVALARFGTFSRLFEVSSSSTDIDPNTPSFTFFGSLYTSTLTLFNGIESVNVNHGAHMATPRPVLRLVNKYNPQGFFPFVDIGNVLLMTGSSIDPAQLAGLTQSTIAGDLTDPSNSVTAAIVTEANYLSAGFCAVDHERPATVCASSGVTAADRKLGLPT